mgnify:CR=1 FL=1
MGFGQQIGAPAASQGQALFAPPLLNAGMVAAEQGLGHGLALPDLGAGVVGAIELPLQNGAETVLKMALRVAQDTGLQSSHGIDQSQGRYFPAREYKIAQADLLIDMQVNETLINALVSSSQQDRPRPLAVALHHGLVESLADR